MQRAFVRGLVDSEKCQNGWFKTTGSNQKLDLAKPSHSPLTLDVVMALIVMVKSSGCGKSTLLRMVAGLETRDQRRYLDFDRKRVTEMEPKDRGSIAMVFQNYALYPHMSAEENMAWGLKFAV